jgi:glutamine amidotransferase
MITIVDYGTGNIGALAHIFKSLDVPHNVGSTSADVDRSSKLILPGVGAFDETMEHLEATGIKNSLVSAARGGKPILGICIGMQILALKSSEGIRNGLGLIDGEVKMLDCSKISSKPHLPHMGWNSIRPLKQHPILTGIDYRRGFYFLHSYYFDCHARDDVIADARYGIDFPTIVGTQTILGVQFHPEKSHSNGIQLLKNFASF